MIRRLRSFREDTSGSALVEFLIVLPVLLLLIVGAFHLGYRIAFYHSVEKAVRNGARYLARVPAAGLGDWADTNAKNLMLTGTLDGTGSPLLPGWDDPDTIEIEEETKAVTDLAQPEQLVVRVTAEVPVDVPIFQAFGFETPITVSATHEERHLDE